MNEEIRGLHQAGIQTVVSLLEPQEVRELELTEQAAACRDEHIEFRSFPIPDRGTPQSLQQAAVLFNDLNAQLLQGRAIAVHCRAGIGRTGLVAGCLLHLLGVPFKEVFHMLSRSRGVSMPDTAQQADWVERFARSNRVEVSGGRPSDGLDAFWRVTR